MCNKNCPPPNDAQQQQRKQKSSRTRGSNRTITSSITNINKREKQLQPHKSRLPSSSSSSSSSPLKQQRQQPSRKTRTKTRRPKYLSLNLVQLSPTHRHHIKMTTHQQQQQQQQQLNLFPLHPENLVEDNNDDNRYIVMHDDVQVASFLFETTTDSSTTLHSLLSPSTTATTTTTESEVDPLSPSLSTYGDHHHHHHHHRDHDDDHVGSLVRTAMKKGRERDVSEERWVCYSEVVEKKESEEVASCGFSVGEEDDGSWYGGSGAINNTSKGKFKLLCLKLDYQEILNAWSDKGPLFVEGENPQIVPDLQDPANVLIMDGWGNVGNLWRVPELGGNDDVSGIKVKEEGMETKENWKMDQRQASVLRYKEKRNSRLFSKRIRYEVRKLNAEKRPRLKGRFVKRN